MANIPPSNAILAATLAATSLPADEVMITASVQSLPDKLAALTRPVQINGVPLTALENGLVTLGTQAGPVTLQLLNTGDTSYAAIKSMIDAMLQTHKPVVLGLQPGAKGLIAALFLSEQDLALATKAPLSPAVIQASTATAQSATTTANVPVVNATILPRAVGEALMPSTLSSPQPHSLLTMPGSHLSASALTMSAMPESLSLTQSFATLSALAQSVTETGIDNAFQKLVNDAPASQPRTLFSASQGDSHAPSSFPLKTGSEWHIRIDAFLATDKPAPPALALAPNQALATIVGKGTDGQIIAMTADKTLYIQHSADAPVGSKLIVSFLEPRANIDLAPLPKDLGSAPALAQMMAALTEIEPMMAARLLRTIIPQPNAQLAGALLFFFNALGPQGVPGWLGNDVMARLDRSKKIELVAKLIEEFQQSLGPAQDPVIGQWRSWPLPLYNGQQFDMLHLYVRSDRDRKSDDSGYPVSPQTRFLVTMNMSRLGPMQLDGLSQKKQLDLILRSERALPAYLPGELRSLYIKTLDALGLAGSLNFQTGRQQWISVQSSHDHSHVVT